MSASGGNPPSAAGDNIATTPWASAQPVNAVVELQGGAAYWRLYNAAAFSDGNAYSDTILVGNGQFNGATWDRVRTPKTFKPLVTLAVGAEATIWTPAAGKKFRLMGFTFALSAASGLTLRDNTAGTVVFRQLLGAGGPGITVNLGNGILSAAANNVLTAQSDGAANLEGTVWGTEE